MNSYVRKMLDVQISRMFAASNADDLELSYAWARKWMNDLYFFRLLEFVDEGLEHDETNE